MPNHTREPQRIDLLDSLRVTLDGVEDTHIRVAHIVRALGGRSFGIAILLFALPMIIPMPPGVPMTSGIVICVFAVQLILGRQHLWLPRWVAVKRIEALSLAKAYDLAERYLGWMFRLSRPRFKSFTGVVAKRVAGLLFLILGFLMILPIPIIGNILPAFACSILALGLSDHDGLIFELGCIIAALAIILTLVMAFGTWRLMETVF